MQSATLAPWFPTHLQRDIYLTLLHMEPEAGSEKAVKVPGSVIRAALLRRAVEDIHRIIQVRSAKQACTSLLQRGSVSDDLWQRFLRAEKDMEDELRDVVLEVGCSVSLCLFSANTDTRQMRSRRIGDRRSSSPPTNSPRITLLENALAKSKHRSQLRRSGGRSDVHLLRQTS